MTLLKLVVRSLAALYKSDSSGAIYLSSEKKTRRKK